LFKAAPSGRRAALYLMQPQALARGVRPPAGPRAARLLALAAAMPRIRVRDESKRKDSREP